MSIIKYSIAFKALDTYVKKYNNDTPKLSNHIRQATASTAKNIIKIYGLSLIKANYIQKIDVNNLPPLKTNNVQLAKMGNVNVRTIQRHLKRLISSNIITSKIWHGSNSGYELFLNNDILFISGQKAVNNLEIRQVSLKNYDTDNQFFKKNITTSCPHTDTGNNSYINNILIGVDNLKSKMSSLPLTGFKDSRKGTGYTEEKCPQKIEDAEGNAREKRVTIQTGGEKSSENLAFPAFLMPYVDSLWECAQKTIYKDYYLTQSQIEKGKNWLYQWYKPVEFSKLDKVHQVYMERIELVMKYIAKEPKKRYVQLPFQYFDPKNRYGFAGTRIWYQKQKAHDKEVQFKLILNAQIRRFINNEKKDTSSQVPRLELFNKCEARLGKLGRPELVHAFHASVLEHTTH